MMDTSGFLWCVICGTGQRGKDIHQAGGEGAPGGGGHLQDPLKMRPLICADGKWGAVPRGSEPQQRSLVDDPIKVELLCLTLGFSCFSPWL